MKKIFLILVALCLSFPALAQSQRNPCAYLGTNAVASLPGNCLAIGYYLAGAVGVPMPVGGIANASAPTFTEAKPGYLSFDLSGNLRTTTAGSAPANSIGITPTDHTIASASGASQTLMAANASRHSLNVENTGNANCGVNPTGGTAVIGGAGTLTLAPLGSYSPKIPTLSAVTVICTAGQPVYADDN